MPPPTEPPIADLLRDGEWQRVWASLPNLPLLRSIELLSVLEAAGWEPDQEEQRIRLHQAFAASDQFHKTRQSRRGLFPIERQLRCAKRVTSLSTTPDGRFIIAGCNETVDDGEKKIGGRKVQTSRMQNSLAVWEAATGNIVGEALVGESWSLSVSPDGQTLATSGVVGSPVEIFRLPECVHIRTLGSDSCRAHSRGFDHFYQHTFCPDGRLIASFFSGSMVIPGKLNSNSYHNLLAFNPTDWTTSEFDWSPFVGAVCSMAVSPNGKFVAAALRAGEDVIVICDSRTGKIRRSLHGSAGKLLFSANGEYLASASADGTVRVWDTNSWAERARIENAPLCFVSRAADGSRLPSTWRERDSSENLPSSYGVKTFPRPQHSAAFSDDSRLLAAAEFKCEGSKLVRSISLIEIPAFKKRFHLKNSTKSPDHFTFTRSGNGLAIGTIGECRGFAQVWSTLDGQLFHEFAKANNVLSSGDTKRLIIKSLLPGPIIEVVRIDAIDFLSIPLAEITTEGILGMRELSQNQSGNSVEKAMLELAAAICPTRFELSA